MVHNGCKKCLEKKSAQKNNQPTKQTNPPYLKNSKS